MTETLPLSRLTSRFRSPTASHRVGAQFAVPQPAERFSEPCPMEQQSSPSANATPPRRATRRLAGSLRTRRAGGPNGTGGGTMRQADARQRPGMRITRRHADPCRRPSDTSTPGHNERTPRMILSPGASRRTAAAYSPAWSGSTIGDGGLSFSVRNGKRRFPAAIATAIYNLREIRRKISS